MVNFDSIPARSAVNIPQHAFDYLGIHRYGEYEATELLTGNTEKLTLMPDKTTPVLLDGMNGKNSEIQAIVSHHRLLRLTQIQIEISNKSYFNLCNLW